jgi:hypothetical protein
MNKTVQILYKTAPDGGGAKYSKLANSLRDVHNI